MENEWLDIACINHEKYIVHGQIMRRQNDVSLETRIEQVLTEEQKTRVDDLLFEHGYEMHALLRGFINDD